MVGIKHLDEANLVSLFVWTRSIAQLLVAPTSVTSASEDHPHVSAVTSPATPTGHILAVNLILELCSMRTFCCFS